MGDNQRSWSLRQDLESKLHVSSRSSYRNLISEKFTIVAQVLEYPIAVTLAKLSILAFFNRLFPGRNMRIAVWIVGGIVVANGLHVFLVSVFQYVKPRVP